MKLRARQAVSILVVSICFFASAGVIFGQALGTCAEQISPYSFDMPYSVTSDINDLGEIVWTQSDPAGWIRLNSSIRGQIATDTSMPAHPSINNRGDLVWGEGITVFGILSGKRILVNIALLLPSINDYQEIVARRYSPTGLYSTYRGQLANDESVVSPAINNKGDIVWEQYDWVTGTSQIYGIIAGVRKQITTDVAWHSSPSINDSGEIVWAQPDDMGFGAIYSSTRGRLSNDCLPNMSYSNPALNNCGDVVATGYDPGTGSAVYRIGNATPCGSVSEPNNDRRTAVLLTSDRTITGVLDPASNTTDWYSFTAKAGDPIGIWVNWGAADAPQGRIAISLLDADGMPIGTTGGLAGPSTLDAVAPYTGTYYIRMETVSGRYGYGLYLKVGIGSGVCADPTFEYDGFSPDSAAYSMNALGEIIWSKSDMNTGLEQIFSSTRGQLTFDGVSHYDASGNNRGDLVWIQDGQVHGILSGTPAQLTSGPEYYLRPAINDLQEVVAIQVGDSGASIYSSRRGILTGPINDLRAVSLNNRGDVVWEQSDGMTGLQIYGIISGVLTHVSPDNTWSYHPSINDSGEVVWSQTVDTGTDRIFSNVRGQITGDCPYSQYGLRQHKSPVINSCGDIAFMAMQDDFRWYVHRSGSASPCVPDFFTFAPQIDQPLNTSIVSNSVLVSGLTTTTSIAIAGGEYEINGTGTWTSANGKITNGDSVRVRLLSSDKGSTTTEANLMIGGGIGAFKATTLADAPPPAIVITSPVSGLTNRNSALLTYTASAGTVVVTLDGVVRAKVSGDTLDALADGAHTIRVEITDTAGRAASASVTFTVDTQAPLVSISNPAAGMTNVKTPQLIYSVSDGTPVVKVDGIVVDKASGTTLDPLADGLHVARLEATDDAGNVGFAEVTFTIDTVPPTISIDPVKPRKKYSTLTISGTREEGAAVAVSADTTAAVGQVSYETASAWSCTIDRMAEGMNTVTATASDGAGNTASAAVSIRGKQHYEKEDAD